LLALADTGGIVTFHPYAHRTQLDFDSLVRDFVTRLAEKMGTHLSPYGRISALVASDWYDDGPRDLGGSFDFLEPGSAFLSELAETSPDEVVAKLQAGFAPVPLNELTLPLALELDEVKGNPARLRVVLREAAKLPALPPRAVYKAAKLAIDNGDLELARNAWCKPLESVARDWWRRERHFDSTSAQMLVKLDPSAALRLLRFTRRGRSGRMWNNDPYRLEIAAGAHEALHRPRQAMELFLLAAKHAPSAGWRKQLKERAKALEEGLAS
jgi:hypothetical protein